MDFRRDRKRSLKFREMLETQEYEQAQDADKSRQSPFKEKAHTEHDGICHLRELTAACG